MGDVNILALVVPTIAAPIQNLVNSDLQNLTHLRGLKLAHPVSSMEKLDISLLVGVDHYWDIVGNHIMKGRGPTAMQSKLGYLLSGPLLTSSAQECILHTYTTQTFDVDIPDCTELHDTSLLSSSGQSTALKPESFMAVYQQDHISRDKDGHYVVRDGSVSMEIFLPSNHTICDRQTRALARKLARQPDLWEHNR